MSVKYTSKWLFLLLLLAIPSNTYAIGSAFGFCEAGNQKVTAGGLISTTNVQKSYPQCIITVYNPDGITLATIYSDSSATPLANPFTANANGTWQFFAANGTYSIVKSAGLPSPGITPPVTTFSVTVFDPNIATGLVLDCSTPKYKGSTAGAKIIACIADLPSTGGTADARGFQGTQAITSIITISKPVKLLLGSATFTSTVTAGNNSIILLASAGASVECAGPGNTQIIAVTDSDGISITSGPAYVKNCTLTGPDIGASVRQGINGGTSDVDISGNVIEKWGNGINTGAGSNPGLHWKIHDNTVRLNNADGIFIPSDNNIASNNQVYGNFSNGIDLNGSWNTISANVLVSNGSGHSGTDCWGILLAAVPGLNSNNNTVVGNTIDKSTCQNIILKPTTNQTVNGNTISGNTATGAIAANGDGIALDGSSAGAMINNIITGNKTSGNARHGIVIDGSVGTVTGNTVSVNISSSNVSDGILVTSGASSNKLSDNISLANGTNLVDSGTGTVKSGNIITSGPGFWIDSAADGVQGLFYGDRTNGWALSERVDSSTSLRITASGIPTGSDRLNLSSSGNLTIIGSEQLAGATPTAASGYLGLGTTNSVGSGTSGTTVTTVTKGAGNGPTTAQTVVNYLKISISGVDYWIPLMQVLFFFRRPKYRVGWLK